MRLLLPRCTDGIRSSCWKALLCCWQTYSLFFMPETFGLVSSFHRTFLQLNSGLFTWPWANYGSSVCFGVALPPPSHSAMHNIVQCSPDIWLINIHINSAREAFSFLAITLRFLVTSQTYTSSFWCDLCWSGSSEDNFFWGNFICTLSAWLLTGGSYFCLCIFYVIKTQIHMSVVRAGLP